MKRKMISVTAYKAIGPVRLITFWLMFISLEGNRLVYVLSFLDLNRFCKRRRISARIELSNLPRTLYFLFL